MLTADGTGTARTGGGWVTIDLRWCKSCSICVAFCPTAALGADEAGMPYLTAAEQCTGCGLCELMCPDFAIEAFRQR